MQAETSPRSRWHGALHKGSLLYPSVCVNFHNHGSARRKTRAIVGRRTSFTDVAQLACPEAQLEWFLFPVVGQQTKATVKARCTRSTETSKGRGWSKGRGCLALDLLPSLFLWISHEAARRLSPARNAQGGSVHLPEQRTLAAAVPADMLGTLEAEGRSSQLSQRHDGTSQLSQRHDGRSGMGLPQAVITASVTSLMKFPVAPEMATGARVRIVAKHSQHQNQLGTVTCELPGPQAAHRMLVSVDCCKLIRREEAGTGEVRHTKEVKRKTLSLRRDDVQPVLTTEERDAGRPALLPCCNVVPKVLVKGSILQARRRCARAACQRALGAPLLVCARCQAVALRDQRPRTSTQPTSTI